MSEVTTQAKPERRKRQKLEDMEGYKPSIYGLTRDELIDWAMEHGEKKFRATQIWDWLYKKRVQSFEEMTNISKDFIAKLNENFCVNPLKQRIVHDVLVKYKDIPKDDAIGILAAVGGFEFTCIVGVILGAAAHHGMVIIDGFNTSACALVAKTLVPASMDYVMASHLSAEKAAKSSLQNLGLEAYVDLGLCLGEASGGSVQMGMLDLAVHMYKSVTGGKA